MVKPLVAALILTYNDSLLTTQLCNYLLKQGEADYIIVVDNSDDNNIQTHNANAIPGIGEKVTHIQSLKNEGYAAGNNIGIKHILENTDAEYIWIINNDIIPQDNAALAMVKELKACNDKAICGSVLLYHDDIDVPDEKTRLQSFGGGMYYPFIGKSKLLHKNLPLIQLKDQPKKDPDYVMGASMMVHRNIFTEVGLLPEEYFMYFEELDWQTLAKKYSYKLIVAAESLVFHLDSLSTKSKRHSFYFYLNRGAIIYTRKYFIGLLPVVLLFRTLESVALVPGRKNKLYSLKGLFNGLTFRRQKN